MAGLKYSSRTISHLVKDGISLFGGDDPGGDAEVAGGGSRNKVSFFKKGNKEYVLRVTTRGNRTFEHVSAEVDFINFLADRGLSVARAVLSENKRLVEEVVGAGNTFLITAFEKAPGVKLADKGYSYREQASPDEYFFNYGAFLGKMHKLSKEYGEVTEGIHRPVWLDIRSKERIRDLIPASYPLVIEKCCLLWDQLHVMPRGRDAYGLIHADFGDSNFTIDYATGKITAFDFDDSCYCWFMYDLANAWRLGTGWIRHEENRGKRREFMEHYFDTVLAGYSGENDLSREWIQNLDFFLKMVEMEKLLDEIEYMYEQFGEIVFNSYLNSLLDGIAHDILRFGFLG